MQRPLATTGGNQVFDFTKRKRWADLLVTELAEAIILILSPQCKVLFCGNAVTEMLGWRDSDLIDCDLADFMNGALRPTVAALFGANTNSTEEDKVVFKADFYESIKQRKPMSSYARIWSQSSASTFNSVNGQQTKDTLFEIQGSAHYNSDSASTCKCFFAVAKPFPSRNTAMFVGLAIFVPSCILIWFKFGRLDTFLESKLENDRLQRRLKSLKTLKAQKVAVAASGSSFTGSRMHPAPLSLPSSSSSPYQMYSSGMTQAQAVAAAKMFDQDSMMQRTPTSSKFDQSMMYGASAQYSPPKQEEDQLEEGGKKKKVRL